MAGDNIDTSAIGSGLLGSDPSDLLKQYLEIDLSGPALLKDDLKLLNRRLDELEAPASK